MNTIIGNKVIAKFMNYHFSGDSIKDEHGFWVNSSETFHNSWDWLMPVVKKIWVIINTYDYDSEEYFHMTEEIFHPDYSLNEFMNADIDSVYNRVIEFIKWYSRQ